MPTVNKNVELKCSVNSHNRTHYVRLDLYDDDKMINTLEFADITNQINDLIDTNTDLDIYEDDEEILKDYAEFYLNRFLKVNTNNNRLDKLLNKNYKHYDIKQTGNTLIDPLAVLITAEEKGHS